MKGHIYKIRYVDPQKKMTERVIRVGNRKGKYVNAYCYLRNDNRTFVRGRILNIEPLKNQTSEVKNT